jgi:hypothetical protein
MPVAFRKGIFQITSYACSMESSGPAEGRSNPSSPAMMLMLKDFSLRSLFFAIVKEMKLRKLYLLWSLATTISVGVGIAFFLIAMKVTYGNFSGHEDFDGLVYFVESLIVIIFSTGVISALLVLCGNKPRNEKINKVLAKKLFVFYSLFALFCVLTFRFAFIYLNPISIVVFALIPKLALDSTADQAKARKNGWFFVGLLLTILLLGGLAFLNIVLSDPYRH